MLLTLDERLKHDADGKIKILCLDMLPQFHPGTRLSHADDALNVSRCHRCSSTAKRLLTNILIECRKLLLVNVADLRPDSLPGIDDILFQQVLGNGVYLVRG